MKGKYFIKISTFLILIIICLVLILLNKSNINLKTQRGFLYKYQYLLKNIDTWEEAQRLWKLKSKQALHYPPNTLNFIKVNADNKVFYYLLDKNDLITFKKLFLYLGYTTSEKKLAEWHVINTRKEGFRIDRAKKIAKVFHLNWEEIDKEIRWFILTSRYKKT